MGNWPNRRLVGVVLAITFLGIATVRATATGPPPVTALLSVAPDGRQGNADSFGPALSADGSAVAFASLATNLAAPDAARVVEIFVRDVRKGATERISQAPAGTAGDGDSTSPVLSGDGRVVAFDSFATNLVDGDGNGSSDVFVHDRVSGRTSLVSVDSAGAPGNADSFSPSISANGRFVSFVSDATGLVPGDHNRAGDVFVHDRRTGRTGLVSVASDGTAGNGDSFSPSISADGRFVAFTSEATNLVPGDTNGAADVFVHDGQTGRTIRASLAANGGQVNGDVYSPSISGDGRYVAFSTAAANTVDVDDNGASDVFVRDLQAGRTTLASARSDGHLSDRGSFSPSLSADGRAVSFSSDGALVPDDTNATEDIFVFDLRTGGLRRVSVGANGTEGNQPSTAPTISGDAGTVAFESLANNLVAADSNVAKDVFWRSDR